MAIKSFVKKLIPKFLLNIYHYKLALLGAVIFGFPGKSKKIKIIGVTGTSGKSTTVDFITRILEESGNKVASISTLRFKIASKEWKNELKMTMPGRFAIQKFLKQAINEKCQYAVLEVSSEGIRQFRHKFINFDTAVFTNLTKEHIESHGGFENYRNEKLKLFLATKNIHIINTDDENAKYFLEVPANKKEKFSIKDAKNINTENGISFEYASQKFYFNLIGEFNIYNALASICVAKNYGISLKTSATALEKVKTIPGRMEIIEKKPFMVVVDYAHTPEQLEGVYKTLNSQKLKNNKLICVLGSCGGGRDKWKRPELGKIAAKYCDKIIITNEDPYDEDPAEIINQVAQRAAGAAEKILNRKNAIKKALEFAKDNDIVIITGKGAEPWMCVENGKKIPWDDRKIAKELLKINN
ncbi:MAG: UDP-N-acetylmuramoyl-L-alanyl-D-glutamate--2,6-diaminopimelate ligase [Patescibacteria group bacterium]